MYEILSTRKRYFKLRVDLADFQGNTSYAVYENFSIDSPWNAYKLVSLGTYEGTAGKSLRQFYHSVGNVIAKQESSSHTGNTISVKV
jgi:Fibrinogen beta and gamma chains, C-terminal globular domain